MAELDRIPPSTTAYVIATAILAGITGYFIGQGASLGLFSSAKEKEGWPNSYNVKVPQHSSSDEDEDYEDDSEEEGDGGELANFDNNNEEVKLVLVVRTDLGMTKGKSLPCARPARLVLFKTSS
jgi:PTH2 family peptidyl-tRNA hydrolase